jgi:endonuclease YncB( thermonuclease family)
MEIRALPARAHATIALLLSLALPAQGEPVGKWRAPTGTLYFGNHPPPGSRLLDREETGSGVPGSPSRDGEGAEISSPSAPDGGSHATRVDDGDTFTLAVGGDRKQIRIAEIDAPELDQPYGARSREALVGLLKGRAVRVVELDRDRYDRVVARTYVGSVDVGAEMVRRGAARVYRSYAAPGSPLLALESEAREARRGLWALPEAARRPPWSWRREHRRGPAGSGPSPPVPQGPVVGNRRSLVYHRSDCPDHDRVAPGNRVTFGSRSAAEAAGYREARNCP